METICVRVRLKPGSLQRVREWAAEINRRANEAIATLEDEGVAVESVFLEQADDGDHLVYYMRAHSLEVARETAGRSHHGVDAYHAEFKRGTWESSSTLELLVDLENPRFA